MDWDFAIERHRVPLLAFVAELFVMIGLTEGATIERVSKPLYRSVLRVLRTAKSAVRRLIIVAARDIVVEPKPKRPARAGHKVSSKAKADVEAKAETKGKRKRGASFKLFDPRKRSDAGNGCTSRSARPEPRIRFIDVAFDPRVPLFRQSQPAPAAPALEESDTVEDDTVNAMPLCRPLAAIKRALEDLQRQAKRYARWRGRPIEERRPRPLRVGRPPGFRKRQTHEVDEILMECHWLARNLPTLDTS